MANWTLFLALSQCILKAISHLNLHRVIHSPFWAPAFFALVANWSCSNCFPRSRKNMSFLHSGAECLLCKNGKLLPSSFLALMPPFVCSKGRKKVLSDSTKNSLVMGISSREFNWNGNFITAKQSVVETRCVQRILKLHVHRGDLNACKIQGNALF